MSPEPSEFDELLSFNVPVTLITILLLSSVKASCWPTAGITLFLSIVVFNLRSPSYSGGNVWLICICCVPNPSTVKLLTAFNTPPSSRLMFPEAEAPPSLDKTTVSDRVSPCWASIELDVKLIIPKLGGVDISTRLFESVKERVSESQ